MKPLWALRLDAAQAHQAAVLRAFHGVDVCATRDGIWLRGPCDGGAIERAMWLLPGDRFQLTEKSQLTPWGRELPVAECPGGPWTPLAEWIRPGITAPALPGTIAQRVALALVRGWREQPAALLQVDAGAFAEFINAAPAVRLWRLAFAVNEHASILVRGEPLPSLPGTRYALAAGIALPCGLAWSPAVKPQAVAELLGLEKDDIALFSADGSYQVVPADAWVPLSRSAARITLEGLPT